MFIICHNVSLLSILSVTCCRPHAVYTDCGSACPITCQNKDDTSTMCIDMCVPGCFCDTDYIEDGLGGCVLKEDCPDPRAGARDADRSGPEN
uniref:TIL domain-containing protein n=1 Tax=Leptobrachium leishanense TaxID=445787 RepID=A0A8C5Q4J1_9ANUR